MNILSTTGPVTSSVLLMALLSASGVFIWAVWCDVRTLTIPNRLPLSLVALYPGYVLASAAIGYPIDWVLSGAIACVVLAVCFGLFACGWFGGGDAKLLAVASLWAGSEGILILMVTMAIVGGVMALVQSSRVGAIASYALYHLKQSQMAAILSARQIPYAIAISSGALLALTLRMADVGVLK